jgi:hypothetical protein
MSSLRNFVVAVLLIGMAACSASTAPSPTGSPAASGASEAGDCGELELLGPAGQPVELAGVWAPRAPADGFFQGSSERTWIQHSGSCLQAAIMDDAFRADPDHVGTIDDPSGNLGIRHGSPWAPSLVAPLRLLIEFQADGAIRLVEDRDPEVDGPRCYTTPGGDPYCPPPVILYQLDEL